MMMLVMNISRIGLENIPPGTLVISAALSAIQFLNQSLCLPLIPSDARMACVGAGAVFFKGQYSRLLFASLLHLSDYHLVYNVSSFLWKGRKLEPAMGTIKFVWTVLLLALLGNSLHVLFAVFVFNVSGDTFYLDSCAVGFSGVLFALKVIINHAPNLPPLTTPSIMGMSMDFQLPTKHMAWVELLMVYLFMPYTSLVSHVCGIVAGLIYVSRTLALLFDLPDKVVPAFRGGDDRYHAHNH